jgi:hypothetical protein
MVTGVKSKQINLEILEKMGNRKTGNFGKFGKNGTQEKRRKG